MEKAEVNERLLASARKGWKLRIEDLIAADAMVEAEIEDSLEMGETLPHSLIRTNVVVKSTLVNAELLYPDHWGTVVEEMERRAAGKEPVQIAPQDELEPNPDDIHMMDPAGENTLCGFRAPAIALGKIVLGLAQVTCDLCIAKKKFQLL